VLYHAGQVKALPGRPKTELGSVWPARITERGSLPSSFMPPEDIRRLRTHTRYRRALTQARTAEMQRVEKLLEDAHFSELCNPSCKVRMSHQVTAAARVLKARRG
jgi:transposase